MAAVVPLRSALVRIGFSAQAATNLTDVQGMVDLDAFKVLTDDEVDNLCKIVRKATTNDNGDAVPGLPVTMHASNNLKLMCFFLRYKERTSRPLLAMDVTIANLTDIRPLKKKEEEYTDPEVPDTSLTKVWTHHAQMSFFATRDDPLIGGSYMTLLNTFANLGGTFPASLSLWLLGTLSKDPVCTPVSPGSEATICTGGRDPFVALQLCLMAAGLLWVFLFRRGVQWLEHLPDDAWRTHLSDDETVRSNEYLNSVDVELGGDVDGTRTGTFPFSGKTATRKDR